MSTWTAQSDSLQENHILVALGKEIEKVEGGGGNKGRNMSGRR